MAKTLRDYLLTGGVYKKYFKYKHEKSDERVYTIFDLHENIFNFKEEVTAFGGTLYPCSMAVIEPLLPHLYDVEATSEQIKRAKEGNLTDNALKFLNDKLPAEKEKAFIRHFKKCTDCRNKILPMLRADFYLRKASLDKIHAKNKQWFSGEAPLNSRRL